MRKYIAIILCLILGGVNASDSILGGFNVSASDAGMHYYDSYDDCGGCSIVMPRFLPYRVYASHLEGRGIGYNQGYSSIGLLYTPGLMFSNNIQAFVDVRAHIFNNGKPAANAGFGVRYLDTCRNRVYGANLYYDYRKAHHTNLSQIGFGLEYLGNCWDLRFNGYFPIESEVVYNRHRFHYPGDFFAECSNLERPLSGFDAEYGRPFWRKCSPCEFLEVYAAAGPYYYTAKINSNDGKSFWGVRGRVAAKFWDYIEIEARTTYDKYFKCRGEGVITFSYPFGGCCEKTSCCNAMKCIAVQPVYRQEIIAVGKPCCHWRANFDGF